MALYGVFSYKEMLSLRPCPKVFAVAWVLFEWVSYPLANPRWRLYIYFEMLVIAFRDWIHTTFYSILIKDQRRNRLFLIVGIIQNGGAKPNIIPEKSVMEYYIRTPTMLELASLKEKITSCFESAAKGTGCTVSKNEHFKTQRYKMHMPRSLGKRIIWSPHHPIVSSQ